MFGAAQESRSLKEWKEFWKLLETQTVFGPQSLGPKREGIWQWGAKFEIILSSNQGHLAEI